MQVQRTHPGVPPESRRGRAQLGNARQRLARQQCAPGRLLSTQATTRAVSLSRGARAPLLTWDSLPTRPCVAASAGSSFCKTDGAHMQGWLRIQVRAGVQEAWCHCYVRLRLTSCTLLSRRRASTQRGARPSVGARSARSHWPPPEAKLRPVKTVTDNACSCTHAYVVFALSQCERVRAWDAPDTDSLRPEPLLQHPARCRSRLGPGLVRSSKLWHTAGVLCALWAGA